MDLKFFFSFPCNFSNMHLTYRLADAGMFGLGYASNKHYACQENMKAEVY